MTDRPEDVDAAFAEIVADLEREGVGAELPSDLDTPDDPAGSSKTGTIEAGAPEPGADERPAQGASTPWRGHGAEWDWSWGADDEHYVPPEPPPLPRLRPMTITALLLLVVGVLLLISPAVIGLDSRVATPIGLVGMACGACLLLLRIRQTPPPGTDREDGAQV